MYLLTWEVTVSMGGAWPKTVISLWNRSDGTIRTSIFNELPTRTVTPIEVPPKLVSSVMFGGNNLDVLYATSIGQAVGNLKPNDADGGLYAIRGLGVKGKPEPRFAG